jgi:hypothetical protein
MTVKMKYEKKLVHYFFNSRVSEIKSFTHPGKLTETDEWKM